MKPFSPQMRVAMAEAGAFIAGLSQDSSVDTLLIKAMEQTCGHWLCTNEDDQFRAAVGAVMLHYGPASPEFKRIEHEMKKLNKLSALLSAAQAGLRVSLPEEEPKDDDPIPLGILGLWHLVKGGQANER